MLLVVLNHVRQVPAALTWWHRITRATGYAFDQSEDVAYASLAPTPAQWAQVMPVNGTGVRAAGAYAPGHKVAVSRAGPVAVGELARELTRRQVEVVVFHGYFDALPLAAREIRRAGMRSYCLWHGSATQLFDAAERRALAILLTLREQRIVQGIAAVKPGMAAVSPLIEREPIYNFAPRIDYQLSQRSTSYALLPSPPNWVKNVYTNLYAAASEPRLSRIALSHRDWQLSQDKLLPAQAFVAPCFSRKEFFALLSRASIVLNASLTECQLPMVALEAAAHRVPCLVPPTALADDDPYIDLCTVRDPADIASVRRQIGVVLDAAGPEPTTLHNAAEAFLRGHQDRAVARWLEWLA